jgi:hypothetical protein
MFANLSILSSTGRRTRCCASTRRSTGSVRHCTLNVKLHKTLVALGFSHSVSGHTVYARGEGASRLLVGIYIDDLIITGNDDVEIVSFKK